VVKECAVCAGLAVISFVLGTAVTTNAMQAPSPSPSAGATTAPTAPQAVVPPPGGATNPLAMPSSSAKPATPAKKMYCN
jgi:hypothetical protein